MVKIFIVPIKAIGARYIVARCVNQDKPGFMPGAFNHCFIAWCANINRRIFYRLFAIENIYEFCVIIFGKENIVMGQPRVLLARAQPKQ